MTCLSVLTCYFLLYFMANHDGTMTSSFSTTSTLLSVEQRERDRIWKSYDQRGKKEREKSEHIEI